MLISLMATVALAASPDALFLRLEQGRTPGRVAGLDTVQSVLGPEEALVLLPDAGSEGLWVTSTGAGPWDPATALPPDLAGSERLLIVDGAVALPEAELVASMDVAHLPSATHLVRWRQAPAPPLRPVGAVSTGPRTDLALSLAADWPAGGRAATDQDATEVWLRTRLPGVGLFVLDVPGARELTATDHDDGLLSAEELSRLPLHATVVVSPVAPAEPERFRSGALTAGASAVVLPSSEVDDDATRAFLDAFLGALAHGEDVGQAHRAAVLGSPPAARAFRVWGDPRARPAPGVGGTRLGTLVLWLVLLAGFGAVAGWALRRRSASASG